MRIDVHSAFVVLGNNNHNDNNSNSKVHNYCILLVKFGSISTLVLFAAPACALMEAWRERSMGQLSFVPLPLVLNLPSCLLWMLYGLPIINPNSIPVTVINLAGFVFTAIYICIFYTYSDRNQRLKILKWLCTVAAIFVLVVPLIMLDNNHKRRSSNVRLLCCICGVFMYGSSLWDMPSIIRTRSAEDMSLAMAVAVFVNASVWTVYSYKYSDIFVVIPNTAGVLFSLTKFVLYAIFRRQTLPSEQSDDTTQPLLQSTVRASMQSNENNADQLGDGAAQLNENEANESSADQEGDGAAQLIENEANQSSADQVGDGAAQIFQNEAN